MRISIIGFLLFVLVACANNENALDQPDSHPVNDETISSIFTGSSNDAQLSNMEQVHFPNDFEFNMDDGFPGQPNTDNKKSPEWERQNNEDRGETRQDYATEQNGEQPRQRQTNDDGDSQPLSAKQLNEFEMEVIELTNAQREKAGLPALQAHTSLSRVAELKSRDMVNKDYFSHTSPTYGSPFDMMSEFGIAYQSAGENIAHGQQTPQQVVNAWMGSEGHRANILNNDFTHIGVGYVKNGDYWTQMFIEK